MDEPGETVNPELGVKLGTQDVATITLQDNDAAGATNPIITQRTRDYPFFVRQQYLNFLSRETSEAESDA